MDLESGQFVIRSEKGSVCFSWAWSLHSDFVNAQWLLNLGSFWNLFCFTNKTREDIMGKFYFENEALTAKEFKIIRRSKLNLWNKKFLVRAREEEGEHKDDAIVICGSTHSNKSRSWCPRLANTEALIFSIINSNVTSVLVYVLKINKLNKAYTYILKLCRAPWKFYSM